MPFRRRGSFGRRSYAPRAVINTIKHQVNFAVGTTGTNQTQLIAKAVTSPSPTVSTDVPHGCIIKAVYTTINGCGLGGTGVQNNMHIYIMKNPGNNLTAPGASSVGTSNEKKFVYKQWMFMIMRNQDGNTPFHWEGWIPVPKRYQRMGTDDTLIIGIINTASVTGHCSGEFIYKDWR